MTLAIGASPGMRQRDAKKARAAQGEQQTNRTDGMVSPVLDFPLAVATAPQASRNTYRTGSTPRQQRAALQRLSMTLYEGKRRMTRKRSKRNCSKPGRDSAPGVDPSVARLAAVPEQIATMEALPLVSAPPHRRRRRCAT
jgi:hypothetical protein